MPRSSSNNMKTPSRPTKASLLFAPGDDHALTAAKIRSLRASGNLEAATQECRTAIERLPGDAFFPRILGDLLFEQGKHEEAFIALADFLAVAPASQQDHFAKRYARFRRVLPPEQMRRYATLLSQAIAESSIDAILATWAQRLIVQDLPSAAIKRGAVPALDRFIDSLTNDNNFVELAKAEKLLERNHQDQLLYTLNASVLNRLRTAATYRSDLFCASIYERFGFNAEALKIVSEILILKIDAVAVRTLFRLCRNLGNYDEADKLLARDPGLAKTNEFNILYELAYYYEERDDVKQLMAALKRIESRFAQNTFALRTVRNFYIRFGLLEEAQRLEPSIALATRGSGKSAQFLENLVESEAEVTSKIQQLYSELEHQKQLAAISDLTTGISHELGQPITNIRYTIQFYRRAFEKRLTKESVLSVFDSIMEETKRMGGLISRLAPLTSSKAVHESFDAYDRIFKRVSAEQARLQQGKISVKLSSTHPVMLFGDPVKFDQLISNLLLNSIDALNERKESRPNRIEINLDQDDKETRLSFADTGVGIPFKNRNTIFDPFFSTKAPGKGEGLGLFIVWNILKAQGATIKVDQNYTQGAKFDISFPLLINS